MSQDHIEMFFSAVRSRGGFNNNPTAKQFKAAYKRLLCHTEIVSSKNANCLSLDDTNILNVSSAINKHAQNINLSSYSDCNPAELDEEVPIDLASYSKLGKFVEDVVGYIAGFVVKSLSKKIKCDYCVEELIKNPAASPLLLKKNRGGLKIPGNDVVRICRLGEKSFRRLQAENKLKLKHAMQISINYSIAQIESNIFPNLEHIINQIPLENHRTFLIKAILFEYLKIRFYHFGKIATETLQQKKVRSINSKKTLLAGH